METLTSKLERAVKWEHSFRVIISDTGDDSYNGWEMSDLNMSGFIATERTIIRAVSCTPIDFSYNPLSAGSLYLRLFFSDDWDGYFTGGTWTEIANSVVHSTDPAEVASHLHIELNRELAPGEAVRPIIETANGFASAGGNMWTPIRLAGLTLME